MKKILFAIVFVTMMAVSVSAQRDGFFSTYNNLDEDRIFDGLPTIPYGANVGGITGDVPAQVPLGTGLLIFTALGSGYALAKRKKKQ